MTPVTLTTSRAARTTRREDHRALVEAGQRYHAAKLAYLYSDTRIAELDHLGAEYAAARGAMFAAAEVYAVGRRKASITFGHQHYARSKKQSSARGSSED